MFAALNYGIIGLGFLLAALAARLLVASPGPTPKTPIYIFMLFSISIVLLGIWSKYIDHGFDGDYRKRDDVDRIAKNIQGELDVLRSSVQSARDQALNGASQTSNSSGCLMLSGYARKHADDALVEIEKVKGLVATLTR